MDFFRFYSNFKKVICSVGFDQDLYCLLLSYTKDAMLNAKEHDSKIETLKN